MGEADVTPRVRTCADAGHLHRAMPRLWPTAGTWRGLSTTSQQLPSLTLYGRSFNVPTVRLQPGVRPDALHASLAARREVAPLFFRRTPVVIDVEEVPDELDQPMLADFVAMFRRLDLVPVGIANATAAQKVRAGPCARAHAPFSESAP